MHQTTKKAVLAALFGNLGIALFKLVAAVLSRSSSMLAESYHSISDTLNQVLLLYGLKRSQKVPDESHRFGYGKEQFFWPFMVTIILFGVAGILSIREGYHKFRHPEPLAHIVLTYLALGVGLMFETVSFRIAIKKLLREMKEEQHCSFLETMKCSKDPTTLTVFTEDALAIIGLLIAAVAITLVRLTGRCGLEAQDGEICGIPP